MKISALISECAFGLIKINIQVLPGSNHYLIAIPNLPKAKTFATLKSLNSGHNILRSKFLKN